MQSMKATECVDTSLGLGLLCAAVTAAEAESELTGVPIGEA
ncbi:MAG: hypothetical protein ABWY12_20070 [Burkholderiales bacterium]